VTPVLWNGLSVAPPPASSFFAGTPPKSRSHNSGLVLVKVDERVRIGWSEFRKFRYHCGVSSGSGKDRISGGNRSDAVRS